jgi:hypothetical protein
MTTEYAMTDTLPKDAGGAKHLGVIDDSTSMLDYALIRGVGAESLGNTSKNLALIGVGSHTIGSAIGHEAGVTMMGAYTESPSGIGTGNVQMVRTDKEGAIYTRPASGIPGFSTAASLQTVVSGSVLLHGVVISGKNVNTGDTVTIQDGNDAKLHYVFGATSEVMQSQFTAGLVFNTSLNYESDNTNASVTLVYSQY